MSRIPPNVRDRLFYRSLVSLTALTLATFAFIALVPSLRPMLPSGLPFLLVFGVAFGLVRARRMRAAAWLVGGLCGAGLLVLVILSGGAESRHAAYLPMTAIVLWSWLGRQAGLGGLALMIAVLVGASALHPPPLLLDVSSDLALTMSHLVAVVMGAVFLGALTRELRSVTERANEQAEQAERMAAAAREAQEARDRFLEMVSHELRTPLDVVLGYAELLREEEQDEDRARDLDRIHSAGRQLLALVDDLLDMTHVMADNISLHPEPVLLDQLVHEVVETIAPVAASREDRLTTQLAPDLPPLWSDRRPIRQILLNLVSNSAKYTEGGEIVIEVTSPADGEVRLSVKDTGIGIPPERLCELFQPFVQLHEGAERRPGIGLGLALSQKLAERLGGRIEAQSAVGEGSTFTLVLPLRQQP